MTNTATNLHGRMPYFENIFGSDQLEQTKSYRRL